MSGYTRPAPRTETAAAATSQPEAPKQYPESVGAVWLKETRTGERMMSMTIHGRSFVAFVNPFKEQDKHPDFRVFESNRQSEATRPAAPTQPDQNNQPKQQVPSFDTNEEIPW